MKHIILSLLLVISTHALAQDAEKGKALSATCGACHGMDGNSVNPIWPSIAGQHEKYIERQLHLFKSGERASANMAPMVAALTDQNMKDLAAFFASQDMKLKAADPEMVELGQKIYQGGIKDRNIPACLACHGPTGQGNPLSGYPKLANQHAAYTVNELKLFRAGRVIEGSDNANDSIMAEVTKYLSDEEITAVASYIQGLQKAQ